MADPGPSSKRIRLSRNKKKTWRKLSRDVDNLLPEQTKLELVRRRSGGFYIDIGEAGQSRRQSQQKQQQQQQKAASATSVILSGLRCYESLSTPDADAAPVLSKRQKQFNDKPLERRVKQLVAAGDDAGPAAQTALTPGVDLWGGCAAPPVEDAETARLLQHHMRCTRQAPVRRRFHGVAGRHLPVCLVPKSGASYNPSLADHQALLASVSTAELDKQRRADRLHSQLERHFPASAGAAKVLDAAHADEMAAGLFADDGDEVSADDGVVEEEAAVKAPELAIQSGRTSRKQNAEVRRQKAQAAEAKRRKRLSADLGQLRALGRQADRAQLAGAALQAARLAKRRVRAAGTGRHGRHRFEELEEEFKLADELRPSLRQLRPEGDLFVDAVKSYQRRNIIEPRLRVSWRPKLPAKRYKKKGQGLEGAA